MGQVIMKQKMSQTTALDLMMTHEDDGNCLLRMWTCVPACPFGPLTTLRLKKRILCRRLRRLAIVEGDRKKRLKLHGEISVRARLSKRTTEDRLSCV